MMEKLTKDKIESELEKLSDIELDEVCKKLSMRSISTGVDYPTSFDRQVERGDRIFGLISNYPLTKIMIAIRKIRDKK